MVSALESGSRGRGSSPGRVTVLCSWERHFTLTVPLHPGEDLATMSILQLSR